MHDSITKNIMTLLECGAFGTVNGKPLTDEVLSEIVPMSAHKWRKMVLAAEKMGVLPYIAIGAEHMKAAKDLSPALMETLKDPNKKLDVSDFDTTNAQLYNHWTSKRLEEVHEEEMNSQSLSEETLTVLDIIIANADEIITRDVSIEGIIALGSYVRHNKEKIDFEKLNKWLAYVGMINMASLQGCMLIQRMAFSEDELPFVTKTYKKAGKLFMNSLTKVYKKHTCSNATRMNISMIETVSHRFVSAISLVTDIEE